MNVSTTSAVVPMYVELGPASLPVAGTAAALLRDYLGILGFHFQKPGVDRSASAISDALGALPGLLMLGSSQSHDQLTLASTNPQAPASGLAGIVAGVWGIVSSSPRLLPLTQPITAHIAAGDPTAPEGSSLSVSLIVLERPASGPPLLGCTELALTLRQSPPTSTVTATQQLSVDWSRTTYGVVDADLAANQQFADQFRQQGFIADLAKTPGYLMVAIS